MTIIQAIQKVLKESNKPLTYKEIYKQIIDKKLYEFNAKNPLNIVRWSIRKHCFGLDFSTASKIKHFKIVIDNKSSTKYALYSKNDSDKKVLVENILDQDRLPEEKINEFIINHKRNIQQELLDNILNAPPSFFEALVVELLLKMGYGWDEKESGYVNGGVGDGGIDGIIKEDKLGLGKIYIQAKRYTKTTIGRPDLQQFVGAMENNRKGVYITTSRFTKSAISYIEKQMKDIVLIDGEKLTDLLVENQIGIQVVKTFVTYKIDKDYFE